MTTINQLLIDNAGGTPAATFDFAGVTYTYDGGIPGWTAMTPSGTQVTVAATAPAGAAEGDLWYDTTNDILNVFVGNAFVPSVSGIDLSSIAAGSLVRVNTAQDGFVAATAGADYQTPLVAGTDYQTPLTAATAVADGNTDYVTSDLLFDQDYSSRTYTLDNAPGAAGQGRVDLTLTDTSAVPIVNTVTFRAGQNIVLASAGDEIVIETANFSDVVVFPSTAARNASTATIWHVGDVAVAGSASFVYSGTNQIVAAATVDGDWTELLTPTGSLDAIGVLNLLNMNLATAEIDADLIPAEFANPANDVALAAPPVGATNAGQVVTFNMDGTYSLQPAASATGNVALAADPTAAGAIPQWDGSTWQISEVCFVGQTAPSNPIEGDLWYFTGDSTAVPPEVAQLFVFVGTQFVAVTPAGSSTGGGGGGGTFLSLTDTPVAFGTAGQLAAVNSATDALEFIDAPATTISTGVTLPASASNGDLFFYCGEENGDAARLFIFLDEGTGSGWIDASADSQGTGGTGGGGGGAVLPEYTQGAGDTGGGVSTFTEAGSHRLFITSTSESGGNFQITSGLANITALNMTGLSDSGTILLPSLGYFDGTNVIVQRLNAETTMAEGTNIPLNHSNNGNALAAQGWQDITFTSSGAVSFTTNLHTTMISTGVVTQT